MGVKSRAMGWPAIGAVLALGLVCVAYGAIVRPRLLLACQIRNHAICQSVDTYVHGLLESTFRYPARLGEALGSEREGAAGMTDGWGNPLLYESDGTTFLLVSYGRDGKPDGSDYRALRELGDHPPGSDICGDYDADEVLSDRGWHRLCGK